MHEKLETKHVTFSEAIVTLLSPVGALTSQEPGRTSETNCWNFPAAAGALFYP